MPNKKKAHFVTDEDTHRKARFIAGATADKSLTGVITRVVGEEYKRVKKIVSSESGEIQ